MSTSRLNTDFFSKVVRPAPATYSTSLRSTHVPDLSDSPSRLPPEQPSYPDPLNFSPSLSSGYNTAAPLAGEFYDNFGAGGDVLGGGLEGTQTPLQEGLFDGGFLDWVSGKPYFIVTTRQLTIPFWGLAGLVELVFQRGARGTGRLRRGGGLFSPLLEGLAMLFFP